MLQNDQTEKTLKRVQGSFIQSPSYPNVFILSKKFESIEHVMIADVLACFPLDGSHEKMYTNLHFRFETALFNSSTNRKIACFRDVICPDEQALAQLAHVPVPLYNKKIRMKVLVMPPQAGQKKMPQIDTHMMKMLHRRYARQENPSGLQKATTLLDKTTVDVKNMADQLGTKVQSSMSAAKDVLGGIGSIFQGSGKKEPDSNPGDRDSQLRRNLNIQGEPKSREIGGDQLNFSDDEKEGPVQESWEDMASNIRRQAQEKEQEMREEMERQRMNS